ncbi:restriction endonuclease subunit S [Vibrio parahaemolyticus]|nr:type I restriction endonuclease subunit S [Vibrio parahaemolyticus]
MSSSMIPTSWIETTLGNVVDYGVTTKVEAVSIDNDAWILELEDIDKNSSNLNKRATFSERKSKSTKNKFSAGDVLYGKLRPYLNKTLLADKDGYCSTEIIPIKSSKQIHNRYLHYSLKRKTFLDYVESASHGMSMPRLGTKQGQAAPFVLAPYNEQIRIANKLDSILAKVDKAQARLDKIPAILKRFRQSVLAAATSGELTKEWRTLNVVPETELEQIESYWQNELLRQGRKYKPYRYPQGDIDKLGWLPSKLGAICDVHVGSTPKRTEKTYWGGDVKWVSSSEVAFCEIFDTKEKITTLGLDNSSTRLHPPGTVMLAMIGQGKTRGQPAILRAEACHNQNTAALRVPEPFLLSEYLYYFLWEKYEETRKIGGGNNQKALNKATVQSIDISLPSIREQRAIVKKIERLFKKANKVEKQYLEAKARLERLTQSILAKAFRGELVQQDPSDEPAEKLLERILAEKEQRELKKTTRKRTKNAKTAEKE